MEWDPELLAKLRELRESTESRELRELRELRKEVSLRRKHRKASSLSANQATTSQIKMIVGQWYTDELGKSGAHDLQRENRGVCRALRFVAWSFAGVT
jgi:hypothetical protein